jgi:hypothetical protein
MTSKIARLILIPVSDNKIRHCVSGLVEIGDSHERGNNSATIAKADLHGNADASFNATSDIVAIPHHHDWNHRVSNCLLAR